MVILGGLILLTPPRQTEYQPFKFCAHHHQYIEQHIQRPIPEHQVQIIVHQSYTNPQIKGSTHQLTQNQYLIHLNQYWQQEHHSTMDHELIHVKQMVTRELERIPLTNIWLWKQDTINWNQPYLDRPWEQEARLKSARNHTNH